MSDIRELVLEEKWKRWDSTRNIHLLSEDEVTNLARLRSQKPVGTSDDTSIVQDKDKGRRPVDDRDIDKKSPSSNSSAKELYSDSEGLTAAGAAALKANNVWSTTLTQLSNFQAGKQLSQKLGEKLADKTGIDPIIGAKIVEAVLKQILEHVDEVATVEMQKTFPGIFEKRN